MKKNQRKFGDYTFERLKTGHLRISKRGKVFKLNSRRYNILRNKAAMLSQLP